MLISYKIHPNYVQTTDDHLQINKFLKILGTKSQACSSTLWSSLRFYAFFLFFSLFEQECAGISVMLTLAIVDIQADDRVPCSHPLQTACIALLMDLMQDYEGILHGGIEPSSLVEIMSSLCLRQGAGVAVSPIQTPQSN
jgi:hypothetical protein